LDWFEGLDWDKDLPYSYGSPTPRYMKWFHGYGAEDTTHVCR
jgi:hypothetical protein